MTAYTILDIDWHDEVKAAEYRKILGPSVEKFGGKTLVANSPLVLDGDWSPRRIAVMEFPSMEALQSWYRSPDHAPALQLRRAGAKSAMIAVERPTPP
ncbi:MAG TPA: DUF1330 domain-containing protein [Thermoplasmata archaeon]|nr:DUF1330 domain-containing protein [Thermoplasmata archaeon]